MNIIDGLQKKSIKIVERLITTIGWTVMLGYLLQTVLSIVLWLFNASNFYTKLIASGSIYSTVQTFFITVTIAISALLIFYFWGRYNKKMYAHLNRRTFPKNVTPDEVEAYFRLDSSIIEKMQKDKIIILERTII